MVQPFDKTQGKHSSQVVDPRLLDIIQGRINYRKWQAKRNSRKRKLSQ